MPLLYTLCISFAITCLLVSCLCLCMYTHGARTHEARAWFPKHRQKGRGNEHVDMGHAARFSKYRRMPFPFGYVLFQTPSFLLPFSLRWFVLGISCHVPFVLISRVWRPLLFSCTYILGHALGM